MFRHWKQRFGPGAEAFEHPGHHHKWHHHHEGESGMHGHFGVRRPLRFLAWKLNLDENQVSQLATILNELKTERAQAEVDDRRTLSSFADAMTGDAFGNEAAKAGIQLRLESANRLATQVEESLKQIHTLLKPEQREKFSYLVRTGWLTL